MLSSNENDNGYQPDRQLEEERLETLYGLHDEYDDYKSRLNEFNKAKSRVESQGSPPGSYTYADYMYDNRRRYRPPKGEVRRDSEIPDMRDEELGALVDMGTTVTIVALSLLAIFNPFKADPSTSIPFGEQECIYYRPYGSTREPTFDYGTRIK